MGGHVTDPEGILREFHLFYSSLYDDFHPGSDWPLLDELEGIVLPENDREDLDKPFLPLEIEAVIHSLPNNKSLEPDVLPGEWYKTYADLLVSKLHQLFAHCLEAGRLPDSMYQAQIVLLPNPGKDLTCCSSYRPISLMNYDFKILAKVLANRIMKVLPSLNNIDQTGFMPGKSTDINIQ